LPRDGEFLQYAVESYPLRLLALDTLVPGQPQGRLCDARLAWLQARLREAPGRPTLILMHHPPFATGIAPMDRHGFEDPDRLAAIVREHPQVERVVCGHLHRPIHVRWAGTIASTAPSTAHQIVLDLDGNGSVTFNLEPPACQLHLWRPGVGLVSHVSYIDEFPGPYPFRKPMAPA
jgi:3',5'-cyclic AMP phosphodiesterase CpdA